jgi:hypothetical protein
MVSGDLISLGDAQVIALRPNRRLLDLTKRQDAASLLQKKGRVGHGSTKCAGCKMAAELNNARDRNSNHATFLANVSARPANYV